MGRVPIVVLAVGVLGGAFAELHHLGAVAAAVALMVAIALRFHPAALRAGLFLATLVGILDAWAFGHPTLPPSDGHIRREPAIVVDERPASDGLMNTTVRFADGTQGSAELPVPAERIGARIVLRGKRVPFDEARNPGEPSTREIASERGLSWRIARARVMSREPPDLGDASLYCARLRAWASTRIHERFSEPEATILAGAMWGERGPLAPDLREEFQETGTVHVLVTAGLHLGVVAALSLGLLQFVGGGRIGASLGAIAIVWLYAAISGDHLPSVRAATMLSFALLARAAGRESTSWNALAAAAIVVTAMRPASLTSVSFALSFSCVAAIFAFAKPIAEALDSIGAPHLVREALAVAFATQLGTWPLTASAFLVIAPYAPLANALVVPIVGVAMLGGFVTLALAPIPMLAGIAANIETSFVDWIVAVVRFVASLPFAHVVATPPPPWTIAVYDGALVGAAIALHHGRVRRAIAIVVCASALCLWPPRVPNHDLRVVAIDVGQADALLIRTPSGHAYLVDAGGRLERGPQVAGASSSEEIGERIVVPFLIRNGIHHLDAVLLSHPHGDHQEFDAQQFEQARAIIRANRPSSTAGDYRTARLNPIEILVVRLNRVINHSMNHRDNARTRSGRPPLSADGRAISISITLPPMVMEALRRQAKKAGKSASSYLSDLITKDDDELSKLELRLFLDKLVAYLHRNGLKSMVVGSGMPGWDGMAVVQNDNEVATIWVEKGGLDASDRLMFRWTAKTGDTDFYKKTFEPIDISWWSEADVAAFVMAGSNASEAQQDEKRALLSRRGHKL